MPSDSMKSEKAVGLYCELYWGENLSEAWCFEPDVSRILAAPDETAALPLYGFGLPDAPVLFAERLGRFHRIHVPPEVKVERLGPGKDEQEVLLPPGGQPFTVDLEENLRYRLSAGRLSLLISPSSAGKRLRGFRMKDAVGVGFLLLLSLGAPLAFLVGGPDPVRQAANNARALSLAREKAQAERRQLGVDGPLKPLSATDLATQKEGRASPLPLRVH